MNEEYSVRGFRSVLQTDLYQLTMAAAYHAQGHNPYATFELFVRKLPSQRSFLVAAGLEEALSALETLAFTPEEVDYIRQQPAFSSMSSDFFESLLTLRFTGEVWAVPEGTVVFPNEPLLRVTAPLIEAQLVETYLLSVFNFSTMVATKAVRIVEAAQGRGVLEFGTRRAHGPEAGLWAARSAYIGGFNATSNVEAGMRFGIPIAGTCAHSFIMSFEDEMSAFEAYQRTFPDATTLLIDTLDTLEGAHLAASMHPPPQGVRIDSGDLGALALEVRSILDQAGCEDTYIVVSSDLNEWKIQELIAQKAPIDWFGVGTELSTVKDAPSLSGVYKLVEQQRTDGSWRGVVKNSPSKPSFPGKKQIFRVFDVDGIAQYDVVGLADEEPPVGAVALLECVMQDGKRCTDSPSLDAIRTYCRASLQTLPASLKALETKTSFSVQFSPALEQARLDALGTLRSK